MQTIKSSEISDYLFCPTSWWLGKDGIKITKAVKEGEKHHKTISENQPTARFIYIGIIITIFIIIALTIAWFLK